MKTNASVSYKTRETDVSVYTYMNASVIIYNSVQPIHSILQCGFKSFVDGKLYYKINPPHKTFNPMFYQNNRGHEPLQIKFYFTQQNRIKHFSTKYHS
jgi:hypothetical protein